MVLDFKRLREEIIDRFEGNIQAHWDKDVDYILDDIGDCFFSMSEAEIIYPSRDELRLRFIKYLDNTTFTEYSSLMKPDIGFSDDGSTAWGSFKVKVNGETVNENGSKEKLDFVCAWL